MSDYSQLSDLGNRLGKASRDISKSVDQMLMDAAKQIQANMLALVRRKTGRLANSITIVASPGRVQVGPVGVPYSDYVEFGTGIRGDFPTHSYVIRPKTANFLVFQVNGKWVKTKKVVHPGIRAHPYIRPAAEKYYKDLGPAAAGVGAKLVSKQ